MVRVQSLLLRSARKEGWLLGGTTLNGQLSESPFLLHPEDNHAAGFYQDPIAVLDFASLYPSLFMAYNLCCTTLVHPEDAKTMPAHQLTASPTGAQFVVASVQRGVLPRICGALITARKQARDRMVKEKISPEEYAVLDGRQKALKLCSNALYGFTGASALPQHARPLADFCLSMGQHHVSRLWSLSVASLKMPRSSMHRSTVYLFASKVPELMKLSSWTLKLWRSSVKPFLLLLFSSSKG